MKTIGRILLILAAVLLVASGAYAFGRSDWAQQNVIGERGDFRGRDGFETLGNSDGRLPPSNLGDGRFQPDGFGRDGSRFASPFNLGSLLNFARTLVPIALVTLIVALFMRRSKSTET